MVAHDNFWACLPSLLPLCVWCFLDAADGNFFSGIFRALEVDLGITIHDFAQIQRAQILAVVVFVPVWGSVVDQKILSEKTLLVLTAMGWGVCSIITGTLVHTYEELLFFKFLTTAFLCGSLPIGQFVITSVATQDIRGQCYGLVAVCGTLGNLVSSSVSVSISEMDLFGVMGWRVGLDALGGISIMFALMAMAVMQRQPADADEKSVEDEPSAVEAACLSLKYCWSRRSFWAVVILSAEFVTCALCWPYARMWLQYSGYTDVDVGRIMIYWTSGGILGNIAGGRGGDAFYSWSRWRGRPTFAQIMCVCMLLIAFILFGSLQGLPLHMLIFIFGIFEQPWSPGCIRPVLGEIANKGQVASMMAWKMTHVNLLALFLGPTFIEHLASYYGFVSSTSKVSQMSDDFRKSNADALRHVLLTVVSTGYLCMFFTFGILSYAFWRDLQASDKELDLPLASGDKEGDKNEHTHLTNGKAALKYS